VGIIPTFSFEKKDRINMAKKKGFIVDFNAIETKIWEIAEPLCKENGAELIDVEYLREAGNWYLRIYIDRMPAVDHDLCQLVSEKLSDALDTYDPISQSYYLEISSPGLERPLKREEDFHRYAGYEIMVRLYAPRDGKKEFQGQLKSLNEEGLILQTPNGQIVFPLQEIAKAHLVADI
jgi:ribosome maturation factor RimP